LTALLTSEELKSYTQSNHQELEKILVGKMRSIKTNADYIELLQWFYNYYAAVEEQINLYIGADQLDDHLQRRKTEDLLNDIAVLGGSVEKTILATDVPVFANHLQAFGALYVLEGSTLGGVHISKMIRKQLQNEDNQGFSFFDSYGDQTHTMWNKFKTILDGQAANEAEQGLILQSADETFLKFKSWIQKQASQN
jgi:heme oxygenase